MPRTSIPLRRNADAAVEMTALAAGAGPPAKRMATRRIWRGLGEEGEGEADILNSHQGLSFVGSIQQGSVPCRGHMSSRDPGVDRSRRTAPGLGRGAFLQGCESKHAPPTQH